LVESFVKKKKAQRCVGGVRWGNGCSFPAGEYGGGECQSGDPKGKKEDMAFLGRRKRWNGGGQKSGERPACRARPRFWIGKKKGRTGKTSGGNCNQHDHNKLQPIQGTKARKGEDYQGKFFWGGKGGGFLPPSSKSASREKARKGRGRSTRGSMTGSKLQQGVRDGKEGGGKRLEEGTVKDKPLSRR